MSLFFQLKARLGEYEVLKQQHMGRIIEATRKELTSLWDACYYSHDQRDKFVGFYSTELTETLLEEHEEVRIWKSRLKTECAFLSLSLSRKSPV